MTAPLQPDALHPVRSCLVWSAAAGVLFVVAVAVMVNGVVADT